LWILVCDLKGSLYDSSTYRSGETEITDEYYKGTERELDRRERCLEKGWVERVLQRVWVDRCERGEPLTLLHSLTSELISASVHVDPIHVPTIPALRTTEIAISATSNDLETSLGSTSIRSGSLW